MPDGAAHRRDTRWARGGRAVLAGVVAFLVVSSYPAEPAAGGAGGHPEYVGELTGSPGGQIRIKVFEEERGAVVRFRNLSRDCEGETESVTARFGAELRSRDGRFEALSVQEPELSSRIHALTLIEGRIRPSGGVSGFVFSAVDLGDGTDDASNFDECWSEGKVRWRARRVTPAGPRPAPASGESAGSRDSAREDGSRGSYTGSLGSRREPVNLEVSGRGRSARVAFEGTLIVSCDLGLSRRETTIGPARVPLRSDGRFRYSRFTQDPLTRDRTFTRIAGRVMPNGRATGYVSSLFDPWDPFGDTNESECIEPFVDWRARRGS